MDHTLPSQTSTQHQKRASLEFRYGSMNVGKSTQLLQAAFNFRESGMEVAIYTAAVDDRDAKGFVTSRLGISAPAREFDRDTDFLKEIERPELRGIVCLLVDEAQFISPDQAKQLHKVAAQHGLPVIAFGLRSDFRGEPFPGAAYLLSLAEKVQEMPATCRCSETSTMNARFDEQGNRMWEGPQVLIGGNDRYRQVCSKCFYG